MQDKLNHYVKLWNLKNPELIAETFMSHVYRVEDDGEILAIKLLSEDGEWDEVGGALALDYYAGHGAAKLYRYDAGAHLMEYIAGDDLIPLVEAGRDDDATKIAAEVIAQLHQKRGKAPELRSLKSWAKSLYEKAKADEIAGVESIFRRAIPIANELLDNPKDEVVLHADIHHANIRQHPERGYLAFDPKGIYGERTYDAANMLYNPIDEISVNEERLFRTMGILSKELNLDFGRYVKFAYFYGCLSAAWSIEGGDENPVSTLTIAGMLEGAIRPA